jgi:outer membrane protein assembly factor BamE (lipoprotein component of BamABCDE complex)
VRPAKKLTFLLSFCGLLAAGPASTATASESPEKTKDRIAAFFADAATKQQVEEAVGRPKSIESEKGAEIWIYDFDQAKPFPWFSYVSIKGSGADKVKQRLVSFGKLDYFREENFKEHALRTPITYEMVRLFRDEMPVAEIQALLGSPAFLKKGTDYDTWYYEVYTKDFSGRIRLVLKFADGKLVFYPVLPERFLTPLVSVTVGGMTAATPLKSLAGQARSAPTPAAVAPEPGKTPSK